MPDGSAIRTIGEAAEYATSLPRKFGNTEPWQRAAKVLHEAAEHGGPFVFMARINLYRAVLRRHSTADRKPGRQEEPQLGKAEADEGSVRMTKADAKNAGPSH